MKIRFKIKNIILELFEIYFRKGNLFIRIFSFGIDDNSGNRASAYSLFRIGYTNHPYDIFCDNNVHVLNLQLLFIFNLRWCILDNREKYVYCDGVKYEICKKYKSSIYLGAEK